MFLLHHIFPLGSTTPPIATTVFFGANDAALPERTSERQYVPLEEYKENLRKIVHHLKECSPSMLIVLITPPPIDEEGRLEYANNETSKKDKRKHRNLYANGCVEVAKELGVGSVNLWSNMQETQGWQKTFLGLKNEDPNQEFPTLAQMFERTRKRTDGHAYVDTYDDTATKLKMKVERNQLIEMKKEIQEDHEKKKTELEAMQIDINNQREKFEEMIREFREQQDLECRSF
ncbi:hypothetical protein LXL04_009619 [Taraxacum kok-saghyz]